MTDDIKRDIARKNASALGAKYGGLAGQQAALEFQFLVLSWIFRFKFTTTEVVGQLIGVQATTARDKLTKLVKKKLIKKVTSLTVKGNYIYMITPFGAKTLEESVGRTGIPTFNSKRVVNRTLNVHDLCVQFYCAQIYRTRRPSQIKKIWNETYFKKVKKLPDITYRTRFDGEFIVRKCTPDVAIEFVDGSSVAIEYESQSKSAENIKEKLIYYHHYMQRDDAFFQKVIYVFRFESSVKKYSKLLNKYLDWAIPADNYYKGGDDTTPLLDHNAPGRQANRDRFQFHYVEDFSVFYGGPDMSHVTV